MSTSSTSRRREASSRPRRSNGNGAGGRRRPHLPRIEQRLPVIDPKLGLDVAMLVLAAVASIASAPQAGVSANVLPFVVFSVGVIAVLAHLGVYRPTFVPRFLEDARSILAATAIVGMTITFVRVLLFDHPQAAEQAARAWLFASTYLIAARGGAHLYEMKRRRSGHGGVRTLIVGAGVVGHQFAQRLIDRPELGLRPVALLDDDPLEASAQRDHDLPILSSGRGAANPGALFGTELEDRMREWQIAHVVVSFSTSSHEAELDLMRRCQGMGVSVSVLPRLFEGLTDRIKLERFGGIPLLSVRPSDPRGWQYAVKYASDRLMATVALVLLSPVLAAAAIATLLSLGRPLIFRQRRVGLDGREFDLLKFRTMRPLPESAEEDPELAQRLAAGLAPGGVEGADRRTTIGRFLRASSIDELPQLINVLRGDMSMVGPRPERPSYAQVFDESVYRYADRHRVKSGITGWAQVHGLRGKTSIKDRVEWDNYYIENRSLWLDLKIMVMTIPTLLRGRGG